MRVWACSCLTVLLSACASDPIVVTEKVPLLPPTAYLEPCPVSLGDGSLGAALVGLRETVECDRADKTALRAWVDEQAPADDESR